MQLEERKNIEETMDELDEDEYLSEEDEEEINLENKNKYHSYEIDVIKKYNVYFYLDFNINKKYVLPINTDNFKVENYHVYDLIKYIVKKINDSNLIIKDNNVNYSVSLKDIEEEDIDFYINNYELRPFEYGTKKYCKKYSPKDPLKSINEENISFFSKNPLNIMLRKQF